MIRPPQPAASKAVGKKLIICNRAVKWGDGEDGGARGILLRACLAFKLTEVEKNDHISAEQTLRVAGQEKL